MKKLRNLSMLYRQQLKDEKISLEEFLEAAFQIISSMLTNPKLPKSFLDI
jgi:hypothetical protein